MPGWISSGDFGVGGGRLGFAGGLSAVLPRFDGRFARIRFEQRIQPILGILVVDALSADIAYPGGEVQHRDEFLSQPGEIRHVGFSHQTGGAFPARDGRGG